MPVERWNSGIRQPRAITAQAPSFDKQITLWMGQANVRRWADDILPPLTDHDPLGVELFANAPPAA